VELLVDTQSYALTGGMLEAAAGVSVLTVATTKGQQQQQQGQVAQCHIQAEVCYPGNDVLTLALGTIEECCAACAANDSAIGFTFRNNGPGAKLPTLFLLFSPLFLLFSLFSSFLSATS
jgi:hypothetical protein